MSVEAVLSRVGQLEAMLSGSASPAATSDSSSTDFSSALATASGDGSSDATSADSSAALAAMTSSLGAAATLSDDGSDDSDGTDDATTTDPATALAALSSPLGAAATSATAAPTATSATVSALPAGVPYGSQITAAAQANGISPALLAGLIKQESGFNPNAGSAAGARGLTQLMPGTAAGLGVTNLLDPTQSINAGAKYLKEQLNTFGGDVTKALAAYNAGPGAVQRFGGVPPYAETQNYVRAVQANAAAFSTSTT